MSGLISGPLFLTPGEEKRITSTQGPYELGAIAYGSGGRRFRYALAGATNLAAGKLMQAAAVGGDYDELAVAATTAGSTSVAVTLGSTAVTKNQFLNGFLIVEDDAGEAHSYLIGEHAAADASAVLTVNLAPGETVKVAMTTSTTVALIVNPYANIIVHPSPPTNTVLGVTTVAVTAANYCWIQDRGIASVLADGTLVVGKAVMASDGTDGAVEDFVLAEGTPNTLANSQVVGIAHEVAATTEYATIFLQIPN